MLTLAVTCSPVLAADIPAKPSAPVTLNIIDGSGRVAAEAAINAFVAAHPDVIKSVRWESASESDVVSVLTPQVASGNLQVDLVLSGTSALSAGIQKNLWLPIAKGYADRLPNMARYVPPAQSLQKLTDGYAVNFVWSYGGPTIEYNPAEVKGELPKNLDELLVWASKNPGKLGYARPANSGIGRTLLLALPYMLGDKDPLDPEHGWEKTWDYLKKLGQYIDNYPTRTAESMENLASGRWTLIPSIAGWDVGPRSRGQVPAEIDGYVLDNTTWVTDPNYAMVPRGVSNDKLSALLLLINYLISPEGNATAGSSGQYVPGIVVDNVKEDMVPQKTRDMLAQFGRPVFAESFAKSKSVTPPPVEVILKAQDMWDRLIGARN